VEASFPDLQLQIADLFTEGSEGAVRVRIQGANIGPLVGLPALGRLEATAPPTGKAITASSMMIFTIKDVRIANYAIKLDQLGLQRQPG